MPQPAHAAAAPNPNPHFEERVPTPDRAGVSHWAAGLCLLALMAWGSWQGAQALQTPALQAVRWSWADFVNGDWGARWNDALNKNLPAREALIGWANGLRYRLLGGAGDQVRLGRDGWLFSTEELQFQEQAVQAQKARMAILTQAQKALVARRVQLLVVLVPDKARVLAGQTAQGRYPAWNAARYPQALAALRAAGVPVVDLWPVLQSAADQPALYYRTDTHWNQLGAERAAQAVAQAVRQLAPDLPTAQFVTTQQPEAERVGDLLRMMGLQAMPGALRPAPEREAPAQTLAQPRAGAPAGGLLDAPAGAAAPSLLGDGAGAGGPAVALVGSSYSRRGNFDGYLAQALGAEVLNMAKDGGGFIQAMAAYVADQAFKTQAPRVLIWEIPERVLSAPLTELERAGLAL